MNDKSPLTREEFYKSVFNMTSQGIDTQLKDDVSPAIVWDMFESHRREGQERNLELIEVQKEYIKLLGDELDGTAVFMDVHGQGATPKTIQKGKELRAKIKELSK